jgi:hypothetical protein
VGDCFSTHLGYTFCVVDHHPNSCWPFVKLLTVVQFFLRWTIVPHTTTTSIPLPIHHPIYPIPPTMSQVRTTGSTNLWFPPFVLRGSTSFPLSHFFSQPTPTHSCPCPFHSITFLWSKSSDDRIIPITLYLSTSTESAQPSHSKQIVNFTSHTHEMGMKSQAHPHGRAQ